MVHVIAEAGICHDGSVEEAKALMTMAAGCGADSVKFQKRNPRKCVPKDQWGNIRQTVWGPMPYIEYKEQIELTRQDYDKIDEHANYLDINWSASVWDLDSLEFISRYEVPYIKIPSAKITDLELVEAASNFCFTRNIDLIYSAGMSTYKEILAATQMVNKVMVEKSPPASRIVLMHCRSTYPTQIKDLNLSAINTLKDRFDARVYYKDRFDIGYSGHEKLVGTSVGAAYLGAQWIEKHITLNHDSPFGGDHKTALGPVGLTKLVNGIKDYEQAIGTGEIGPIAAEEPIKAKLRG